MRSPDTERATSRVHSFVLQGIEAVPCEVEVHLARRGLGGLTMVGLPDAAVRESADRVRSAIQNVGLRWPWRQATVSLAPGDLRKEGPVFDLPIALAVLAADGVLGAGRATLDESLVAGELALDGRLRGVRGVVSLAMLARRLGRRAVIVPSANAAEASIVEGVEVLAFDSLGEVVGVLLEKETLEREEFEALMYGEEKAERAAIPPSETPAEPAGEKDTNLAPKGKRRLEPGVA